MSWRVACMKLSIPCADFTIYHRRKLANQGYPARAVWEEVLVVAGGPSMSARLIRAADSIDEAKIIAAIADKG